MRRITKLDTATAGISEDFFNFMVPVLGIAAVVFWMFCKAVGR